MALRQGRRSAAFVVAIAIGIVALLGVVAAPPARAALTGFTVSPPQYSGQVRLYVPTETMHVVLEGAPGDVFDVQIINFGTGTPFQNYENVTILSSGQRAIDFTIPADWPDGFLAYHVAVYPADYFETGTGAPLRLPYAFSIQGYRFSVWTTRVAYLPGDSVSVSWSATMIKDGSAAPGGTGEIQAFDVTTGTSLLPTGNYTFAASQGSFSFSLSAAQAPDHDARVYAWFNDTAAGRVGQDFTDFYIGSFGLFVPAGGSSYAPGSILTATIQAEIVDAGGNPVGVGVPDALINVTVVDLGTGSPVADYAASNLRTDAQGQVDYVVQIKDTPTSANYEARAVGTAHDILTDNGAWQFDVAAVVTFTMSLTLDKTTYVSGETARATAAVYRSAPANYTFAWSVSDGANRLAYSVGTASAFDYPIPGNFEGTLLFDVTVDDGTGNRLADAAGADVAFGYVAVSLDPSSFVAGDRIVASFSLSSIVISSPRYYIDVRDASSNLVASGNTTGTSFAYTTPSPAGTRYTFTVTASQGRWTPRGSAMATELYRYTLQIALDRPSYLAGETARIHYRISPEGTAPQRAVYTFQVSLGSIFAPVKTFSSTSPEGDVDVTIPADAGTGDVLLLMTETGTGAMALQTVRIGPTSPLLSEVAGLPVIDWLLTLLVVVLLLAVFFLWRRTGAAPGPRVPGAGRPTPPPPPPSGPATPQTAGPMSVTCKHCGMPIEITTSKRPIEVMCPSCGETQVVQ